MCGIFGIYGHKEAVKLTYYGLYALQHRGQESAGIAISNGEILECYKNMGLVTEVFTDEVLSSLKGHIAIGHVRYSTAGGSNLRNAQPLLITYAKGQIAIAHNGNLVNASLLRKNLQKEGTIFQTTSDSEVILNLIASYQIQIDDLIMAIKNALSIVKGSYSLVIITKDKLIGIKDAYGFRPLCIGKLDGRKKGYVIASETCSLDLIQAKYIREVNPGEIVIISEQGITSTNLEPAQEELVFSNLPSKYNLQKHAQCIFEYIYFARPDSKVFGEYVYKIRKELGKILARNYGVPQANIVIPVPDSGVPAALGYAQESKLPYELGLIRNHYVGRTFIKPSQPIREMGVYIKLNPIKEIVKGKNVVLIDDSIVRGTTCKKIVKLIRDSGAKEIHLRISSPPIKFPCFYGIDTPTQKELIAANYEIDEIREFLGVDSLKYLTIKDLLEVVGNKKDNFCVACFNGEYPIR